MQMAIDDFCQSGKIAMRGVGGYPGVERVAKRLSHIGAKKVRLVPLSIVSGIHAWLEISGDSNPDSWKKALETKGTQFWLMKKPLESMMRLQTSLPED